MAFVQHRALLLQKASRSPDIRAASRVFLVLAFSSGSITGILVALADVLPWFFATALISFFFLVWLVATLVFSTFATVTLFEKNIGWGNVFVLLGLGAAAVALFNSASLYLAQFLSGNTNMTWNVDYRYHLMHSNSLIAAQGSDNLLIASGIPIHYHIGPAWIAASLKARLSIPVELSSFALVPAVSLLSLLVGVAILLIRLGIAESVAVGSVGLSLAFPFISRGIEHFATVAWQQKTILGALFTDFTAWYFSPTLMLNSFFAFGILGASLGLLLVNQRFVVAILTGLAFGAIMATKPQVAILVPIILFLFGLSTRIGTGLIRRSLLVAISISAVFSLATFIVFVASSGGLVSSTSFELSLFEGWSIDVLAFYLGGPGGLFVFLALSIGVLVLINYDRLRQKGVNLAPSFFSLGAGATALAAIVALTFARFTISDSSSSSGQINTDILQGLPLLIFLCSALVFAHILSSRVNLKNLVPIVITSIGLVGLLLQSTQTFKAVQEPERGYQFVDSSLVVRALEDIPPVHLLIVSDLAEPAQNFIRPGDANYIPASTGVQFWVAGFRYELAGNTEAHRRVRLAQEFFGTEWSSWHLDFLETTGITHALISPRCSPVWYQKAEKSNEMAGQLHDWVLISVDDMKSIKVGEYGLNGGISKLAPAYGVSDCLGPQ